MLLRETKRSATTHCSYHSCLAVVVAVPFRIGVGCFAPVLSQVNRSSGNSCSTSRLYLWCWHSCWLWLNHVWFNIVGILPAIGSQAPPEPARRKAAEEKTVKQTLPLFERSHDEKLIARLQTTLDRIERRKPQYITGRQAYLQGLRTQASSWQPNGREVSKDIGKELVRAHGKSWKAMSAENKAKFRNNEELRDERIDELKIKKGGHDRSI